MRKFFTALSITIGLLLTSVPAFAQSDECVTFETVKASLQPGVEIADDFSGPEARTIRQTIADLASVPEDQVIPFDRIIFLRKEGLSQAYTFVFRDGCVVLQSALSYPEYFELTRGLRTAGQ